ncbi:glycosyltransferase family 4 protein [Candidatus Woesebacteria bacterium]|nr:glycosyltransferase family 4 protein [Candidatus Woesebacteria bacterium]MCD8507099.1 glycosyltransferase family 4 protein [Candidatus Woesebacteria bacterium]MCD8527334.1 glycosyltransferase family 4 protein [Candidatus Woesebacteria bacterium]MCD8546079.1 glycosyltransferase family 4 protein [Candidatus Woesebacteria bacterium]
MSARPIRIGFDARLAGSRHAGIGRYAENLLHFLLTTVTEYENQPVEWVVFISPEHDLDWLLPLAEKNPAVTIQTVTIRHYSLAEQFIWPRVLWKAELDLVHVPHFNVPVLYLRPYTVTIHDLLWHQQRDPRATTLLPWVHRLKYGAYRLVSTIAIRRAQYVFVPSKVVRKEVTQYTGRIKHIGVTYEGVGEPYRSATVTESSFPKQSTPKKERAPYVVYTGSLYPHKNVEVVLRALRLLPKFQLKLAGARSVFSERFLEQAERYQVACQVEWLGYVPDSELIALYRQSVAVIQPSLSEGFGLTGLEALATGTPVVASDRPIFHEIYGEHAQYFPARDGLVLSQMLSEMESSAPTLTDRRRFRRHALEFDWHQTGEQTWEKMQRVLHKIRSSAQT